MPKCLWRGRHGIAALLASGIAALVVGVMAATPPPAAARGGGHNESPLTTSTGSNRATTATTITTNPGSTTTGARPTTSSSGSHTSITAHTSTTTTTQHPTPTQHTTATQHTTTTSPPTTTTTAPANSPAANPPTTSNCQDTSPLGLSGGWACTFDDEFANDASLNTNVWTPQLTANSGYTAGQVCYVDNPNTVSLSGGTLNLSEVRMAPFTCTSPAGDFTSDYEAGMVSTWERFDQTYGAFEVNAKLPPTTVTGLQETFWLYPQQLTYGPWPNSGEIDFAEFYSEYAGYDVPYIHYADSSSDPSVTSYGCTFDQNSFHTYEVDWQPGVLTVLYDGQVCLVDHPLTGQEPFDQPFFLALTQALGIGSNAPTAATPTLATTQVAWVRAWKQTSS